MECSYVLVELFAMGEHFLKSKYIHLQLFNELLGGFNKEIESNSPAPSMIATQVPSR